MDTKAKLSAAATGEKLEVNGVVVYVKAPSLRDFLELQARIAELPAADKEFGSIVLAVLYCTHDESGQRVFTDGDKATVEGLPLEVLVKVNQAASRVMDFMDAAKKN